MKKNLKKLNHFLPVQNSDYSVAPEQKLHGQSSSKKGYSKDHFDFIKLIQKWPEIIGEKFSKHSIPLKNQNKTLVILSNHSAFASEMKFLEQALKKKIFTFFPSLEKEIEKVQFVVDSTFFDEKIALLNPKESSQVITKLHPFSPEYKKKLAQADSMFEDVNDDELKNIFKSLYLQS